ncbi:hypothetical protein GEV33_004556 [Tenebrio molitor]|uniref:Uncharacterized protein n=1 Tax=Tenebrio molitor TaxID=7067 RepID=A0A8J6HP50_TENMO|nr:hypothetical protein GEV33_004556 [Tenebrio molitor]
MGGSYRALTLALAVLFCGDCSRAVQPKLHTGLLQMLPEHATQPRNAECSAVKTTRVVGAPRYDRVRARNPPVGVAKVGCARNDKTDCGTGNKAFLIHSGFDLQSSRRYVQYFQQPFCDHVLYIQQCRKREEAAAISQSRSRNPRLDISQNNFPKGQSKSSGETSNLLIVDLPSFFLQLGNFLLSSPRLFFLSRHSRKLSSTYRKITPSCPGLSRGKSVSHRSYRRILEASYLQRSAQAQPPPPKATLTGVPESRFRQRPAPQQLRSDLFILCGNLPSGTDALFR